MENFKLKKYKPVTPSLRHTVQLDYSQLLTKPIKFKKLIKGKKKTGGRNFYGRLTAFKKGGGHKQSYRFISNLVLQFHLPFLVINSIEYDPFKSSSINLCLFKENGSVQYLLSAQNSQQGSLLTSNYYFRVSQNGSSCILRFAKVGDFIYNLALNRNRSYYVARSSGTFCKIMKKNFPDFFAQVALPSGSLYKVSLASLAFLGKVSNFERRFTNLGKAGRNRWLGKRPTVRGVAMNPVDHPHGGGEGKSSGGKPSHTPWGWLTKGVKTRKQKINCNYIRNISKY